jgi:hypothetical protein
MSRKKIVQPTEDQKELLRRTASTDIDVARNALRALAQAIQVPIRSALLNGDILEGIYAPEVLDPSATATFPIDFFVGDNQDEFIAYVVPSEGAIPTRAIVGDEVTVPTFTIANAIDWPLKYARQARWNIVARAMEVLEGGFVRKLNTDGWNAVISGGAGRTDFNGGAPMVADANAAAGQFTKRLVSLMKTTMTRLAGGNSSTQSRGQLTDIYLSPEALEDIRDWDSATDGVDDLTLREIFVSNDSMGNGTATGPLARIYGVNLHSITELGVGQEFQDFFDTLGLSMGASDEEIVVGLDLQENDSFVMPVKEALSVFEDETLHRRQRAGFYGWQEQGFGVLDGRRVLLGSF